ncbi:conserved hypothetical protein [Sideroxydans lithotrophicus ES-1]|uniref:Lipoprotein n=2 Tax=Sideroxydans TaxID=314343 RepID=D5CS59_SIDLE|nr:conserved hypothetical protein [Sideroxydans lithotrophicus ES-1]
MRRFAWIAVLFLVGCANMAPMAVNKQTKNVDVSSKSVILMTLDLARPTPSRYVPHPLWVDFTRKDGQGKLERQVFQVDGDSGTISSKVHNKFLLRFALEPGKYEMKTVFGNANAFPFNGFFQVPLLMEINVPPKTIAYVGRVNALMRPRVGNEFRAGSVIPLIDQAAAGVSGSTFDITVVDASKEDVPEFKSTFASLEAADIQTELLPPFDRNRAQSWWENDGKEKEPADSNSIKQAQK